MQCDVNDQKQLKDHNRSNLFTDLRWREMDTAKQNDSCVIQLESKEEDLVLAAKLGKTLLEQIEELKADNIKIYRKQEVNKLINIIMKIS